MLILSSTLIVCSLLFNPSIPLIVADDEPSYNLHWSTTEHGLLVNHMQTEFYDLRITSGYGPDADTYMNNFLRFYICANTDLSFEVCETANWDERHKRCKEDQRECKCFVLLEKGLKIEEKFQKNRNLYFQLKFQLLCAEIYNEHFEVKLVVRQGNDKSQIFDITVDNVPGGIASIAVANTTSKHLLIAGTSQKGKQQMSDNSNSSTFARTNLLAIGFPEQFVHQEWHRGDHYTKSYYVDHRLPKGMVVMKHGSGNNYLADKLKIKYFVDGGGERRRRLNFFATFRRNDKYQFAIFEMKENERGALLIQSPQSKLLENFTSHSMVLEDFTFEYNLPSASEQHVSLQLVIKRFIGASNDIQEEGFIIGLEESPAVGQLIVKHHYADAKEEVTFTTKWKGEKESEVNLINEIEMNYFQFGNFIEFYLNTKKIPEGEERSKGFWEENENYKATMCDSVDWDTESLQCIDAATAQTYDYEPNRYGGIKSYNLKTTERKRTIYFTLEKPQVRRQVLAVHINLGGIFGFGKGIKIEQIANINVSGSAKKFSPQVDSKTRKRDGASGSDGGGPSSTGLKRTTRYNF